MIGDAVAASCERHPLSPVAVGGRVAGNDAHRMRIEDHFVSGVPDGVLVEFGSDQGGENNGGGYGGGGGKGGGGCLTGCLWTIAIMLCAVMVVGSVSYFIAACSRLVG